jgi:hypothetical protein
MSSAGTSAKLESPGLHLEQLYHQHHKRSLLRTVFRLIGCRQATEDVLQDTYIRVTCLFFHLLVVQARAPKAAPFSAPQRQAA